MIQTIHDTALYVLIFASGMLAGYLLKVAMLNKEKKQIK